MSATTGSTGFKSSDWLTKLSEAREQVVAISNMKNAGAILVTAVQAFGDALFERVDFHKFRKVPECVAAYHDHAKTLNGIVDKFNIDKKKLNCLEKINNFSESLRKAQEESKNRGKGKRKRIVSARTVEDSDAEIEIVTAPATGDTDVTMAEASPAASAHAPKNVKDLPKISKKNAAAGNAGGTTRTIATRASTRMVQTYEQCRAFSWTYNRLGPDECFVANALQKYLRVELLRFFLGSICCYPSDYRSTVSTHLVSVSGTAERVTVVADLVHGDVKVARSVPLVGIQLVPVGSTTVAFMLLSKIDCND
ncbi:hypothetical protein K435DRAFT_812410 [Dendrothele bispora CBS 962.96]|uniref:Uncharacterized protein n=1 Tax=Dendrothele bispora (strain CBS 962.96) TaxID=1314807 RepID=A0A4S8KPB7_DENBC|nr:hypothetical protein K435DRAFT_812410 [Dendrothele bispora CBS 962.96]